MRNYLCGIYTSTKTINAGQRVTTRANRERVGTVQSVWLEPSEGRVALIRWEDGTVWTYLTSALRKVV